MDKESIQRSRAWFLARRGKMTASEIYLLLSNRKVPMTEEELAAHKAANPKSRTTTKEIPFSEGTLTWLNRKVAEYYMPDSAFLEDIEMKQLNSRAVQHGTFWEDKARETYAETMNYEIFEVGFIPMSGFERFCGGSPDGMIREQTGIIEIKCPFNAEVHQDYLLFEKPEDLMEYNLQYYCQCQLNMMVTTTSFCDFVSFDPRTSSNKQLKILRIPRDQAVCDMLRERIALARDYYKERMKLIDNSNTIVTT